MQLGEVADLRSGDKGDISQISVVVRNIEDYSQVVHKLSAEQIRDHLRLGAVDMYRYDLPDLGAINFVFSGALRGGVTRSVALDPHGKTLAAQLFDLEIGVSSESNVHLLDP